MQVERIKKFFTCICFILDFHQFDITDENLKYNQ